MRPAPTAMGFIDLHCHLLPGVDDGALDLDDSVAMARVAVKEGFEAICATPHIRHDHDVRIGEIAGRVAALDEELERREIPLRVLTGGEVAETAVAGPMGGALRAVALWAGGAGSCSSRAPPRPPTRWTPPSRSPAPAASTRCSPIPSATSPRTCSRAWSG